MTGRVIAVSAGRARPADYAGQGRTAIDKRPVAGPVVVGELGLGPDEQGDRSVHGGPYQAVYAYATEDAAFWAAEMDRELWPGAFGENLTVSGVDLTAAVVGERWRIGTVELRVTSPRIPCRTFAGFWGVPDLVKRFTAAGRPGAYLGVPGPGVLEADLPVELLHRPAHGVRVGDLFRWRTGDRDDVDRLAGAIADLPPAWAGWAEKLLAVTPFS